MAPVDLDDLVGDGGGDPSLLVVVDTPEGWIDDPDGDGVICAEHATPQEIVDYENGLIETERLMRSPRA